MSPHSVCLTPERFTVPRTTCPERNRGKHAKQGLSRPRASESRSHSVRTAPRREKIWNFLLLPQPGGTVFNRRGKAFFLFFFNLPLCSERKAGRKRGRETSMCGCLSHAPNWGSDLHATPGMCPRLGIEPATLWFTGQYSIH